MTSLTNPVIRKLLAQNKVPQSKFKLIRPRRSINSNNLL